MSAARVLLLAFLSGAVLMAAELAAPRLIAPLLGTGISTWSAILAVFLGALSLGNLRGGRLADTGGPQTLARVVALSGLAVMAVVPLHGLVAYGAPHAWILPPAGLALLTISLTFAPAAWAIGLIGPALGRCALAAFAKPGRALGAVSAAGAAGSVCGTFLTGFVLIPEVATAVIYVLAGGVLLAAAPLARGAAGRRQTRIDIEDRPRATPTPTLSRGWMALAALAGAALLAVEVIATRVSANRLGTSVYTWTSVIGVVLVALGVGNTLGGRLADRFPPKPLLARLLLASSVAVASCLWTPAVMTQLAALDLPWMLRTLVAVAAAFTLPAVTLGMLTPVVIRAALSDPGTDGRVVGRLYAIGSAGAVLGSLLTSYYLIPWLQVPMLIIVLALVLGLAAWRLGGRADVPWLATLVAAALLAVLPFDAVRRLGVHLGVREDAPGIHVEDSRYFHIRVEPHTVRTDGPATASGPSHPNAARRLRLLSLDRFVHGFVDLDDPLWLGYEYEILQGALVRALWSTPAAPTGDKRVRCFFIGGGAYTFQRRLLHLHRGDALWIVTAEIDPAVTRVAQAHLGLKNERRHVIVHRDARAALRPDPLHTSGEQYDFVFGDAFHDLGVPWHLTTQEFTRTVHKRLYPSRGVYLVNLIDVFASGRFLGAFLSTLESVFQHVRIISMGPRNDVAQETFLLLASDAALSWPTLTDDAGRPLSVVPYDEEDLERLRSRSGGLILKDDYAPVEALLAPVVRLRADAARGGRR